MSKKTLFLKKAEKVKKWGLIGSSKIGEYSIAPKIWENLFKLKKMQIEYFIIGEDLSSKISIILKEYLKDPLFMGANIALPWKYLGYEHCDFVEETSNKVETINTIIKKGNRIEGYNTDGKGLIQAIKKIRKLRKNDVLIIGSGSSAQTIPHYLIKEGVEKIYVSDIIFSRAEKLSKKYFSQEENKKVKVFPIKKEDIKDILGEIDILINATPCGMKGFEQKYPLDKKTLEFLNKDCIIAEAVYNPYETPLLKHLKKKGNKICPGIKMLIEQAAESFSIAFEKKLSEKDKLILEKIGRKYLKC